MHALIRTFVLAQGSDTEGWIDLLFIAFVAVLWLLGAIGKAMQARKGSQQGSQAQRHRERWQERLARKAEEIQRLAEAKGRQVAERTRRAQEELAGRQQGGKGYRPTGQPPAGGQLTVRQGPRGESIMVYERPDVPPRPAREGEAARRRQGTNAMAAAKRQRLKEAPRIEPKVEIVGTPLRPIAEDFPGSMSEPPRSLTLRQEKPAATRQPASLGPDTIIDSADPDALRKAILHYEILGKPLALRDTPERSTGF